MTIQAIHKGDLSLYRTTYDQTACKIGIVHLGYGAFHRAHQAIYIDDYMQLTNDLNWGIAAVNLRISEAPEFAKSSQVKDGYLIKTTDANGASTMRLVRSHVKFSDWPSAPDEAEQLLATETVHIATITVTESGYYLDANGNLDLENFLISNEINGTEQDSVYAYLANGLQRRRDQIDLPISILCCDNVRSNGDMLKHNFMAYLKATKKHGLAKWVVKNVSFPNSMVDRITPRASTDLKIQITETYGSKEYDPIHAEDFSQWVLEDNFAAPAPALSKTGVEIVDDVHPYEEAKIRILNGGHTALAYMGALAGHQTFDEAMRDVTLANHFERFQNDEVLPGLNIDIPFDKSTYLNQISARFLNRAIADQLERICMDGFSKMQLYIRPTLESCLQQNITPTHCYNSIASWIVYARRFKQGSMPVKYHEPYWDELLPLLDNTAEMQLATYEPLWGDLPIKFPKFASEIIKAIHRMEKIWPA